MDNFVVGDDAEVVCVGEVDDIEIVELVTVLGREALKIFGDWIKTHEENHWGERGSLEDSPAKPENVRVVFGCAYSGLEIVVGTIDVVLNCDRKEVAFERELD